MVQTRRDSPDIDLTRKRRREDVEVRKLVLDNRKLALENCQIFMRLIEDLDPEWKAEDPRFVKRLIELLKKIIIDDDV
jgi:hypothetical protein